MFLTPSVERAYHILALAGEIAGWDGLDRFTERAANQGSLGVFEAKHLIRLMQANARRLDKFGA